MRRRLLSPLPVTQLKTTSSLQRSHHYLTDLNSPIEVFRTAVDTDSLGNGTKICLIPIGRTMSSSTG